MKTHLEYTLKDGEIICDKCKGEGTYGFFTCTKCQGEGKLDWVSAVTGVKPKGYDSTACNHTHTIPMVTSVVQGHAHNLYNCHQAIPSQEHLVDFISSQIRIEVRREVQIALDSQKRESFLFKIINFFRFNRIFNYEKEQTIK